MALRHQSRQSIVVVGDQKTYTWLQELKYTYGSELDWLIPFDGDWHVLKNFQSVLMKVYYEARLKDLAEAAGFRGETLTSLKKCIVTSNGHIPIYFSAGKHCTDT